jgi:signal transduction histidine kinase
VKAIWQKCLETVYLTRGMEDGVVEQEYKVLLVEDDEDDYTLVSHFLREIKSPKFELTWVRTSEEAVAQMCRNAHDIVLIDYRLGDQSGVQLLAEAKERGMRIPAVLLTGFGNHTVDLRAMAAGAADYLEKSQVTPALLERSIRYTVENARVNRMLHELSRKLLSAQEDERKYLSKELHDSIGASLTAIKLTLDRKLQTMKNGKNTEEILIEDIISMVQRIIGETKRMQQALRPPVIDDLGILTAVRSLCREFQRANASISIQPIFHAEEQKIPEELKIVVYRISQEALNNILKHSRADKVSVTVSMNKDDLELLIEDNGSGFDAREVFGEARGMGLASMKERAEYSGGIFALTSTQGKGTTIRVSWPPEHILSCEPPFFTSARGSGG